ncbi:MAG: Caspase domain-containing protein [Cyanobacteria bacterium P01_A01_bin.114]
MRFPKRKAAPLPVLPWLGAAVAGFAIGVGAGWLDQSADGSPLVNPFLGRPSTASERATPDIASDADPEVPMTFLVAAGGGAPSYNEIALEKNVQFFQRTLTALGVPAAVADIYFANGNSGRATIRYLDSAGQEQFKAPEIPHLAGTATWQNLHRVFQPARQSDCPTFFYFTGHGFYNADNEDDNALILWNEQLLSVQELAGWLDELPADQPFVTMMSQCFSGSFANLIYEQGDPDRPVALQSRCGFFATVASRPSVGCTPLVNESDYRDYSSSFFAGLSGVDRTGQPVASADYNQDGRVAYAEAHAFAKVDEVTTDWPISTVEDWLQRQASAEQETEILEQPLDSWVKIAAPERRYVLEALSAQLELDITQPYAAQYQTLPPDTVEEAYWMRLRMELINVAMTQRILVTGEAEKIEILTKLTDCEAGSWPGQGGRGDAGRGDDPHLLTSAAHSPTHQTRTFKFDGLLERF